ncbi:TetR/AcrR family transcriptional regulator [Streptosporangium sp. 'caverna']|uniref:TetR/AcrR family transcriptional regulator n=1 Tax=Streptosporangium sp. 'caverna' TaxID=2202249 RepID=UPI000D7D4EF2|nr:TetR/AcrR family transcriptional regulator [Streptosporangium sp. 'caverna']AWS43589.1 TetR/AcrR family transcriptional regulator [Streptosporangium sp. 'caverna']
MTSADHLHPNGTASGRSGETVPPLRKDAERNRERILAAARQAYAEAGLEVSMAEVARRAGVGIATLFRRFPTREDLIDAVFADRMDAYLAAVTTALADPDPWDGFTGYIEAICAMQAADRGVADLLTMTFPTAKALEAKRARAYDALMQLVDRAKAAGRLRPDFTSQDVVILLMANAGVVSATGQAAPDAWRRLVGYMLQAFAVHEPAGLPAAPTPTALYRAMLHLGRAGRADA